MRRFSRSRWASPVSVAMPTSESAAAEALSRRWVSPPRALAKSTVIVARPILTKSPDSRRARWTRWPRSMVPFEEPRSRAHTPSESVSMRQWWRETCELARRMSLSSARPMVTTERSSSSSVRTPSSTTVIFMR